MTVCMKCSENDGSISFDQFCKIPHIGDPIIELPF